MIVSNPIPRAIQPNYHEGSSFRSVRDGDATPRQWLRNRSHGYNGGSTDRAMRYMVQQLSRLRRRIVGGGSSTPSSQFFLGEYNGGPYAAQKMVVFTPAGGAAGTYISITAVSAGISPDVGAPFWFGLPNSPNGVWL